MGCGCKGNVNPPVQTQPTQQVQTQPTQQTESVKSAIKKTVEKYYNATKK
jgi:hypothetical protein